MREDSDNQKELAKLLIPAGGSSTREALGWRWHLIKKENIFPAKELHEVLIAASSNQLKPEIKTQLVKIALSEDFLLDEVEVSKLYVTTLLLEMDRANATTVLSLDRNTKNRHESKSLEIFAKENPDQVLIARKKLLSLGQQYLNNDISKIRAKIAFQEIVAALSPDEMIPTLVSISPKYLGSGFVQTWIKTIQYYSRFDKGHNRTKAKQCLRNLLSAIQGDHRIYHKRKYAYWSVTQRYEELYSWLLAYRNTAASKKDLESVRFSEFLKLQQIPVIYKNRILHSKTSTKQLALEIMTDQGLISDPKAFKDFQSIVSKLRKKHKNIEAMLIFENCLDLPTIAPNIVSGIDYHSVLERVRL